MGIPFSRKNVPKYKYGKLKTFGELGNTTNIEKANSIKYTGHLCRNLGLEFSQANAVTGNINNKIKYFREGNVWKILGLEKHNKKIQDGKKTMKKTLKPVM